MRYSVQKEIVLNALKDNVVHPTAEYLYSKIKEANPNVGMATVYRNLNKMAECGLIKKIDGLEDSAHYDHNTHEHYHFICEVCRKVFDVSAGIAPEIVSKTEKETGFKVNSYDITLKGLCPECSKDKEESEEKS